jgi:tyrosinase
MNGTLRVRKSVWKLGQPGDDLDWYAKAVAALRPLPIANPTSWRYMAAVHGYPGHDQDPFSQAGEALPSDADQQRFWNQCQHQSWFFFPWHRGYLACFEDVIAATVVSLGGPPGWALPYWNYSDPNVANALSLPPAFLAGAGDPSQNPLFSPGRVLVAAGDQVPPSDVALDNLTVTKFSDLPVGQDVGFGGPETVFHHFTGTNGALEDLPHNQIHDDVGGLMGDPNTAALDPIFWLHHANIDRLWEVWTHRNPAFTDPAIAAWLTDVSFEVQFSGGVFTFNPSQMLDPATVMQGYQYDDISDPLPPTAALAARTQALALTARTPKPAALVGASQPSISIAGASTAVNVPLHQATLQSATARLAGVRPIRAFLNLENVTGRGVHGNYEVYVDAPPWSASPLLAGQLSTFGVDSASRPDNPHGGSGITSVLEITAQIEQLKTRGWNGLNLVVTFVPKASARARGALAGTGLRIGRISVYYA